MITCLPAVMSAAVVNCSAWIIYMMDVVTFNVVNMSTSVRLTRCIRMHECMQDTWNLLSSSQLFAAVQPLTKTRDISCLALTD